MGVLSLIIWSLTSVVLIKYVIFILSVDDHGQGGTFALYSVVARALQHRMNDAARFKKWNTRLSTVALISLAMVMSDGILTPAISGRPRREGSNGRRREGSNGRRREGADGRRREGADGRRRGRGRARDEGNGTGVYSLYLPICYLFGPP